MNEVLSGSKRATAGLGSSLQDMRSVRALVVDGNVTTRSILRSMLIDQGLQPDHIRQVGRYNEARGEIEYHRYDLILCEHHFPETQQTGADLLDEVRAGNHLPFSTVVVMVTSEATYGKVAEAAEAALDSYLLRPHTHNELAERLKTARHRKQSLADIFEALEADQHELAAERCLARVEAQSEYWVYAARIGGELLLRLNRHDEARKMFEIIDKTKAMPWARLGIARAHVDAGQIPPALRVLDSLLLENPGYADAYDVMGRAHLQAGEFERAYETYKKAVSLTPLSVGRLQKLGLLAFHLGHTDEAASILERAVGMGVTSRSFDFQSLVMLAFSYFEQDDGKALSKCESQLLRAHEKNPRSGRLRRMHEVVSLLSLTQQKQTTDAARRMKTLAREFGQPDFDFETASNVMCLLVRVRERGLELPDAEKWLGQLAMRFCTNKPLTNMLGMMVASHPPYEELLRGTYKELSTLAETSLAKAKSGAPIEAIETLLKQGAATGNTRTIELADMIWQRYLNEEAQPELAKRLHELLEKFGRRPNTMGGD